MRFNILGPLEVWHAGQPVALAKPQQRAVLAVLLLHPNKSVSIKTVVEHLWNSQLTDAFQAQVRADIAAIRQALRSAGAPMPVVTASRGYRITVAPGELDITDFSTAVAAAAQESSGGDLPAAAGRLRAALALWRGTALEDINAAFVERARAELDDARLAAREQLIDITLELGRDAGLIIELGELVRDYPQRERLRSQLMIALYRAGRPMDALSEARDIRRVLWEQQGRDPGPGLEQIEVMIRNGEPLRGGTGSWRLLQPTTAVRGAGDEPTVERELIDASVELDDLPPLGPPEPAQLPADSPLFVGRAPALRRLDEIPRNTQVVALAGAAGAGKTSLIVHWANLAADRFPDGQLYLDLRGSTPGGFAISATEALVSFLAALGVPSGQIPQTVPAQADLYHQLLAERRVLVLLDNARDEAQIKPLLPATAGCLAVVTSRHRLVSLAAEDGVVAASVDPLSDAEARQLLAARLGPDRVAAEPEAVDRLVQACAGLPLALVLVAARAAASPENRLRRVADSLADPANRLDGLAAGDTGADPRLVFSWSYRALGPLAQRLFRLLSLHPGPDLSESAAASLVGSTAAQTRPALRDLVQAQLVTQDRPGRYGLHDLLRGYAAQLMDDQPVAQRDLAVRRMLDHYLQTLLYEARCDSASTVTAEPVTPSGVTVDHFIDDAHALSWLLDERETLLGVARAAAATGHDVSAWQLAWALSDLLQAQSLWRELAELNQLAVRCADRCVDLAGLAHSHRGLARAYLRLGWLAEAEEQLAQAHRLYAELDDQVSLARVQLNLAVLREEQGRLPDALTHAQSAYALFAASPRRCEQAAALNAIGWYQAGLGEDESAIDSCEQALELHRLVGSRFGEATTWDSLGYVRHRLGQYDDALRCYRRAADLIRVLGVSHLEADVLRRIAQTCEVAGYRGAARQAWHQAYVILSQLNHPDADALADRIEALDTGHPIPAGSTAD